MHVSMQHTENMELDSHVEWTKKEEKKKSSREKLNEQSWTKTTPLWKPILTHCGRVTQICVFNKVKLGTSASSP